MDVDDSKNPSCSITVILKCCPFNCGGLGISLLAEGKGSCKGVAVLAAAAVTFVLSTNLTKEKRGDNNKHSTRNVVCGSSTKWRRPEMVVVVVRRREVVDFISNILKPIKR